MLVEQFLFILKYLIPSSDKFVYNEVETFDLRHIERKYG